MDSRKSIILFDGICNLCNSAVRFIVKRDTGAQFSFASLQSDMGMAITNNLKVPPEIDSIILVENNRVYFHSDAALRIASRLDGGWKAAIILRIIPRFIRDLVYQKIARNRYKWFGRKNECMLPTKELKKRFITDKDLI